jgi:alanine racemase
MHWSRRSFLGTTAAGIVPASLMARETVDSTPASSPSVQVLPTDRFDPWVEVIPDALAHNVAQVSRLSGGRPILAVVKNNAYGLDLVTTTRILEPMNEVAGFAVVKTEAALKLKGAGIGKPVLHMGMTTPSDGVELVRAGVQPSLYTDDAVRRVAQMAQTTGRPVEAQVYVDTGMSRMGMPYHRALPWLQELGARDDLRLTGTYMAFTEEPDFDIEQLDRFERLATDARAAGVELGSLHAASSGAVYEFPGAHLDLVRPGIALFGSYPNDADAQREKAALRCAFRLRARVVRVEQLRTGDSVSYGRNYVAERPTWIATIPAGHVDGVPGTAVNGGRILIDDRTYPVVGSVSASHTIIELGSETDVRVGDIATILGPDHPDIEPDRVAAATGPGVYNLLMHLSPALPRFVAE